METEKKVRKQICFDINKELHQQIKIMSAERNMSINMFMDLAIRAQVQKYLQYKEN